MSSREWEQRTQRRRGRATPPAPADRHDLAGRLLALQRAVGNQTATRLLARQAGGAPLLLADRPWAQIEADQRRRARRPFEGEDGETAALRFPMDIHLPGPPLLLADRPWAEIADERQRNAVNEQVGPGRYRQPGPGPGLDPTSLEAAADLGGLALQAARGPAHARWGAYMRARAKVPRTKPPDPTFERLDAAAFAAAQEAAAEPSAETMTALEEAAAAALACVHALERRLALERHTRKDTGTMVVRRFAEAIRGQRRLAEAVNGSVGHRNPKRQEATAVDRELLALAQETEKGVSNADRERFARLEARLRGIAKGVTIKDEYKDEAATLARDPDDDARKGTEPTLTYRGRTYVKVPGFDHPPLYARIDNDQLRLRDEPLAEYEAALRIGKIAANEQGASGVKEKPLHWEIKLIARRARQLMGDSDLRLRNDQGAGRQNGELQTLGDGTQIRYLVFDNRYNAH